MSVENEFRAALNDYLSPNYYFDEAPDKATYPFRVASFVGSFDDETSEVHRLSLDYWDNSKSPAALYDLIAADKGNGITRNPTGLNKKMFHLNSGSVFLTYDGQLPIIDPDKNLKRIRVNYEARIYYKGE